MPRRYRDQVPQYDRSGHLILQSGKVPLRTHVFSEEFYQGLDVGIRFAVRVLHAAGIETCQSCQGGKGHAYPEPTVDLGTSGSDSWGFHALSALADFGLPVATVGLIWPVANGFPYERLWRLTFSRTMENRADSKVMFIRGYQAQS